MFFVIVSWQKKDYNAPVSNEYSPSRNPLLSRNSRGFLKIPPEKEARPVLAALSLLFASHNHTAMAK